MKASQTKPTSRKPKQASRSRQPYGGLGAGRDRVACLLGRGPVDGAQGAAGREGFHQVRTLVRFSIVGKTIKDMDVIHLNN